MIVLGGLFAILVWLPSSSCLQIIAPNTTVQGADTNITLVYEDGDPNQLFLQKYSLDAGGFSPSIFPVNAFNTNTSKLLDFLCPMRFLVVAVDDTDDPKLETALAQSSEIHVNKNTTFSGNGRSSGCDGGGGGNANGGNEGGGGGGGSEGPIIEDPFRNTSGTTPRIHTGTIIGIAFGVLTFLAIVGVVTYILIRRRRRRACLPQRMVRDSYLPSFRQDMSQECVGSPSMTVHAPSIISADSCGSLTRPSPPPTYHSNYDAHRGADPMRRSVIASSSIPSFNVSPITDRQMQIHQRLYELQQELWRLGKQGNLSTADSPGVNYEVEIMYAKTKIGTLRDFLDSSWAKHQTDEIPAELKLCL